MVKTYLHIRMSLEHFVFRRRPTHLANWEHAGAARVYHDSTLDLLLASPRELSARNPSQYFSASRLSAPPGFLDNWRWKQGGSSKSGHNLQGKLAPATWAVDHCSDLYIPSIWQSAIRVCLVAVSRFASASGSHPAFKLVFHCHTGSQPTVCTFPFVITKSSRTRR